MYKTYQHDDDIDVAGSILQHIGYKPKISMFKRVIRKIGFWLLKISKASSITVSYPRNLQNKVMYYE